MLDVVRHFSLSQQIVLLLPLYQLYIHTSCPILAHKKRNTKTHIQCQNILIFIQIQTNLEREGCVCGLLERENREVEHLKCGYTQNSSESDNSHVCALRKVKF